MSALVIGIVAIAAVSGFAATAITFALRNGRQAGRITVLDMKIDRAKRETAEAVTERDDLEGRLESVITDQKAALASLRDEIDECGDDGSRARAAVDGLRGLMSPELPDRDDSA